MFKNKYNKILNFSLVFAQSIHGRSNYDWMRRKQELPFS